MTDEGSFRVIVANTSTLVAEAAAAQSVSGEAGLLFGRLLVGSILVRQTMSPAHRVQVILHHDGAPVMRVDSFPDGTNRGLVSLPTDDGRLKFTGKTFLEVMRTLHNGALHRSLTELTHPEDVSRGLMAYMQDSEQILSTIVVDCWGESNDDLQACGYIVQVLPEPDEGALMVMTERMADFQDIAEFAKSGSLDTKDLLGEILYGLPYAVLEEPTLSFGCPCNEERVVGALSTLGRVEIGQIIKDGEVIEMSCDYCATEYKVGPQQLRALLTRN